MRCIQLAKPSTFEQLCLVERAQPEAGAGQVLVKWHATSLNYHDLLIANGSLPVADQRIPMADGAGEVVAVGEGVTQYSVGDRVISSFFPNWVSGGSTVQNTAAITGESVDGCAADFSALDVSAITPMPKDWSYIEAATLPTAAVTAWRALFVEGGLQAGQSVLVEGSGGMSIFALQLAKAAGAYVVATTSSEAKAERLKALGADYVVNYAQDAKWGRTVSKHTGGGVDYVLDIGGPSTFAQSVDAVRVGGHMSLIGILGGMSCAVNFPQLFFKQLRVTGLAVGSVAMQRDMVRAIDIAGFKPVIDKSFALDQLGQAFAYQLQAAHFGKIVVDYS